jgi:ParB family transcriptional regulator, chromosome partitioning protein
MPRTATQEAPQVTSGVFRLPLSVLKLVSEAPPEVREQLQVRKSDDSAGMDELEASLRHHGVIYPLILDRSHGGDYTVAGNRRLKCLRRIFAEHLDREIDVVDVRDYPGDEREVAMAVNIALPPHPVDRYEVLAAQIKAGLSPEDVAARNALTLTQVTRILALAELAPEIRDAWREERIKGDVAQAFTRAPSKEDQVKFFKSMEKNNNITAWQVNEKFAKGRNAGRSLAFVGIETYEQAGGKVTLDAFDMNYHQVSDQKLLEKLFLQRMDQECTRLIDDGWSFAVTTSSLGSDRYAYGQVEVAKVTMTKAEKETHAALTSRVEASDDDTEAAIALEELDHAVKLRAYTADHKKRSGCFVDVGRDGSLEIEYGRTKPAEKRKIEAEKTKAKKGATTKAKPAAISQVVEFRLEQQLLKATAKALVTSQSGKGLPGLLARIVATQIKWERPGDIPPTVSNLLSDVRRLIEPKIMQAALLEAFDRKDYFSSIPKELVAAAVSESMGVAHATKARSMTKENAAKFANANVPKGWLPRQLALATKAKAAKRK